MGLDIYVWKEEVLESRQKDDGNREQIIKKTDVLIDKGWTIGRFLQDTFDLDNCKKEGIDLNNACEELAKEVKTPTRNDEEAQNEDYEDSLKNLLGVLTEGQKYNADENNSYVEYFWELSW
jgi:hypothetical protein